MCSKPSPRRQHGFKVGSRIHRHPELTEVHLLSEVFTDLAQGRFVISEPRAHVVGLIDWRVVFTPFAACARRGWNLKKALAFAGSLLCFRACEGQRLAHVCPPAHRTLWTRCNYRLFRFATAYRQLAHTKQETMPAGMVEVGSTRGLLTWTKCTVPPTIMEADRQLETPFLLSGNLPVSFHECWKASRKRKA